LSPIFTILTCFHGHVKGKSYVFLTGFEVMKTARASGITLYR